MVAQNHGLLSFHCTLLHGSFAEPTVTVSLPDIALSRAEIHVFQRPLIKRPPEYFRFLWNEVVGRRHD